MSTNERGVYFNVCRFPNIIWQIHKICFGGFFKFFKNTADFELEEVSDFEFEKNIDLLPFVPKTNEECKEIIEVQATSVYKRLKHIGIEKTVIGVSGGLDSTLVLLSLAYMCDKYNIDRKNIIAITMPSGNNSDVTYNNALKLMSGLGVTQREINIKEHVLHELSHCSHSLFKR